MKIETDSERRLLRALVAEDDPAVRMLIASLLRLDGWEVAEAADGLEAVAMAEAFQPDALLMDVMMPGMDGISAAGEIREQEGNDGCAVIVVSADDGARSRADAIGSNDFVSKPFDPDDLSARARAAMRWHSNTAESA